MNEFKICNKCNSFDFDLLVLDRNQTTVLTTNESVSTAFNGFFAIKFKRRSDNTFGGAVIDCVLQGD